MKKNIYILFYNLFHYSLSQDIKYSFLCYTVGHCCLSILNVIAFIYQPQGKEINTEYSLEGLMLKLKFQYSGHLMQRADSLEKTLVLGKIEGRRRRGQQRMSSGLPWCLSGKESACQ